MTASGAVRRNPSCRRPTEEEWQRACAEWLRLAYDRDGGRKAREVNRRAAATATASLPLNANVEQNNDIV